MSLSNDDILILAKSCGFDNLTYENGDYWECWKEQLLKFAALIYTEGFKVGYDEGWESSNVSTEMNTWSSDDD